MKTRPIHIGEDLHRLVAIAAATEGATIREIGERAMRNELERISRALNRREKKAKASTQF